MKIDLCRITGVREIPWASTVTQVREGQALVRSYDGGKEVISPSAGVGVAGFVGIALSTETAVTFWPRKEDIALAAGVASGASLSRVPRDRANRLAIFDSSGAAVTVSTDGGAGSGEIDVSATGAITGHSSTTAGTYTFVYEYEPTAAEVRTLQGDTEPGNAVNAELMSNSVIIRGDVYTTDWDVEADWDDTNAAFGVRLASDGRFTVGTATAALAGVSVIQYPTVDQEFLGLRLS